MRNIKRYSELIKYTTFIDRFRYLKEYGTVGEETFGVNRYLNQNFYRTSEWKKVRDQVIIRDLGCDLGIEGRQIYRGMLIHHMNPISIEDILERRDAILNPEFLITTTFETHQAIHYGDEDMLIKDPVKRYKNDTCPWKR